MANDNTIEIVVKLVDKATAPLRGLAGSLGKLSSIAGLAGLTVTLNKIIRATSEAQRVNAQLNSAYKATGATVGLTRERMEELAEEIQRTTVFEDELVKSAQSVLLTFNKVRGEAFERTIKVAADLSARLGTDLVGATRLVGIALQDPERGMSRLRRAGIILDEQQRQLIKSFVAAGEAGKAQEVILAEIEKRYKGAAVAARNTLGGALQSLSNAYGNLFEMSESGTKDLQEAIESLTTTLSEPSTKQAIQDFFGLIIAGAEKALQIMIGLGSAFNLVGDERERIGRQLEFLRGHREGGLSTGGPGSVFGDKAGVVVTPAEVTARIRELEDRLRVIDQVVTKRKDPNAIPTLEEVSVRPPRPQDLEEARVTATRIELTAQQELLAEFERNTQTTIERTLDEWAAFAVQLQEQMARGLDTTVATERAREAFDNLFGGIIIRNDEAFATIKAAFDDFVKEFGIAATDAAELWNKIIETNIEPVKVTVKKIDIGPVFKEVNEMGIQMARNIQDALAQAFDQGGNIRDFLKNILSAFRTIMANALAMDLGKLLGLDKLGSGGSSGGSAFGAVLKGIGAFFGFGAAEGGEASGITRVGEEGPETVILPRGSRVVNQRQAMFSGGGGGNVSVSQQTNITVQGSMDQDAQAELLAHLAMRDARIKRDMLELLEDNGFGRLRTA